MTVEQDQLLECTVEIVTAYISNNPISGDQLCEAIQLVHKSLSALDNVPLTQEAKLKPAVPVRHSVKPDFIVCLADGKRFKMLKRHLSQIHNMTPDEYRQKWGLPRDYPMVAPDYAEKRSELAKQIGLGTMRKGQKRKQRS